MITSLSNLEGLKKIRNSIEFVIPAKAGIQLFQDFLDPGLRRGDPPRESLRDHQVLAEHFFLFPLFDDLPLFQLQHVGDAVQNFLPMIGYVEKLGAGSADFFQDSQDSD